MDILAIGALTDTAFDLRLARVRYTFTDGTSEELPAAPDGTRPPPRAAGAASPASSSPALAATASAAATAPAAGASAPPGPTPVLVPDAPNGGAVAGGSGVGPAAPGHRFTLLWFAALPALAALGLGALLWRGRRR